LVRADVATAVVGVTDTDPAATAKGVNGAGEYLKGDDEPFA
jgi:hypothetical protein